MTEQLSRALKGQRHLRGNRVFLGSDGKPITRNEMKKPLWRICRRAGLRQIGWHVLRHTFCSHLAMQGAVPKAIQELAGHSSISTTMRYMHLAPAVLRETVRLLDRRDGRRGGSVTAN
jgi:site-specific recombinase XerD